MDYTSRINSLYNKFNNLFEDAKQEEGKYKEFIPSKIEEKVSQWRKGKLDSIRYDANSIYSQIKSELNTLTKKIPSIKYPLRNSVLSSDKTLSEQQRTNAFLFLQSTKNLSAIKEEISNSFNISTDYFSYLLDLIYNERPPEVALITTAPKETRDFYSFVDNLKNQFENDNNISSTKDEIKSLKSSLDEVEFLRDNLEANFPLITLREIKISSVEDLKKYKMEAIDKSMGFFNNRGN